VVIESNVSALRSIQGNSLMTALQKSFIAFLLYTFLFSACTPSTDLNTPSPHPSTPEKPSVAKTATSAVSRLNIQKEALRGAQVKVWHPWFGAEASLFESQIADFNKLNEWGIVVTAEGKENYGELYQQTLDALKASSNPHIVIALPEYALGWQQNVVDLNTYLHDPEYGFTALEISDFANAVWSQDEVGGIRYGVPAQRTARFMLYNQTWARELGFDSPPRTSTEFEIQACAAHTSLSKDADTKNDALGGWLIDMNAATALSWMLAFDGGVQEEDGYRFLTPGNIAAFKYLKVLQQKGCAWVPSPDLAVNDRFVARQALFATAGLEELPDQARAFLTSGSKDEWTVLAFPGAEHEALVVYGSSFVMFRSDAVTQLAAWLFIRWMLSPENQARWVQSTGLFPLRASTMDLLGNYSAAHPQWAEAVKLLSKGETVPQLASWRLARVMLSDGFADMFDVIRHPDLTDGQVPVILKQMDDTAAELNK
jgi:multiple sugar transport system substrate-binding protein